MFKSHVWCMYLLRTESAEERASQSNIRASLEKLSTWMDLREDEKKKKNILDQLRDVFFSPSRPRHSTCEFYVTSLLKKTLLFSGSFFLQIKGNIIRIVHFANWYVTAMETDVFMRQFPKWSKYIQKYSISIQTVS